MSEPSSRVLAPTAEFESAEASLFVAQLDDVSRRLRSCVDDAAAEEFGWQPAPGANTIGMLLAHVAINEVFWVSVLRERAFLCQRVLGIGSDDDGMPLPDGQGPPDALAGRSLAFYDDLLMRAREHTRAALAPLTDADLRREIEHRGRDERVMLNGRWILYHLVEHEAGHAGQVALLRHLYRVRPGR